MLGTLLFLAGAAVAYTDIEHKPFMRKNMDPIIFPGKFVSHMHSFYGSDTITKDLPTTKELQQGCPSGENPNDMSIYWAPTLYYVHNNNTYTEIYPSTFKTYYENIDHAEMSFPEDFHAVAGNATGKSQADINEKTTRITWWCDSGPEDRNTRPRAAFPRVTCSAHMQAILSFPDCVDPGKITDYTYSALHGGRCPSPMKRMPTLRFSIRYNTRAAIPQGWSGIPPFKLACGEIGDGYCFHGDFINGWFDDAGQTLLKAKGNDFLRIDGAHGNGKIVFNKACKPKDRSPDEGTSDYHKSLEMMEHRKKRNEERSSVPFAA